MPVESVALLIGIGALFGAFAAAVAWAERQTRGLHQPLGIGAPDAGAPKTKA